MGSPSLMNDKNRDFLSAGLLGFAIGNIETGGAPNVTQWMRLKQPVRMLSSDSAFRVVQSICE